MSIIGPSFKERLEKARKNLKFAIQEVISDFTEQVQRRLRAIELSKVGFAGRLGASPAYITKMLKGETNFTIETMTKVAKALDSELEIRICPRNAGSEWFYSESVILMDDKKYAHEEFQPTTHKKRWIGTEAKVEFKRQTNLAAHETVITENR
jgi:transcriptional regulator with XRE-family HTH domain